MEKAGGKVSMTAPRSEAKKPHSKSKKEWLRSHKVVVVAATLILVIIIAAVLYSLLGNESDSAAMGEYHDTNTPATASFEIDVDYTPNCEGKENCDPNKQVFEDTKLFVFDKSGQQVRVVRADEEGVYKASLPEDDYILLVSKTFKDIHGLPQETVTLKNGKVLKTHRNYGVEQ